jgi:heme-degrading monooxygenase HmoA
MIAILWTYDVKPEYRVRFEAIYSPDGEWAQLFRQAKGYIETELLRRPDARYATIDRWERAEDFAEFKVEFRIAYEALDERCDSLMLDEQFIGQFDV